VRCSQWNINKPTQFAAGTFSGVITIFDVETTEVVKELIGVTSKIICIAWHPLFDYILASGS